MDNYIDLQLNHFLLGPTSWTLMIPTPLKILQMKLSAHKRLEDIHKSHSNYSSNRFCFSKINPNCTCTEKMYEFLVMHIHTSTLWLSDFIMGYDIFIPKIMLPHHWKATRISKCHPYSSIQSMYYVLYKFLWNTKTGNKVCTQVNLFGVEFPVNRSRQLGKKKTNIGIYF